MRNGAKSRRKRKDKWGNRMAIIGITLVVGSLAVVVNIRSATLREKAQEYEARYDSLQAQYDQELERSAKLEEERVYVQTKQYIEKIAKEKLGMVKEDEILLNPSNPQ